MGLIISLLASGSFVMTAFGIFGEGTCSFSGRGGARVLMVTTYSDGSGAISCNLAAVLMLLVVGAYWAYVFSESGYSGRNSYSRNQSFNSDLYERPLSTNTGSSPVENFLKDKDTFNESGYKQAKAEEELVEAQEIIDNYMNKEKELNTPNEIDTIELEIKELQEKKQQMLLDLEIEKERIAQEKFELEKELKEKKEIEDLKKEIQNLKKEIEDLEQ